MRNWREWARAYLKGSKIISRHDSVTWPSVHAHHFASFDPCYGSHRSWLCFLWEHGECVYNSAANTWHALTANVTIHSLSALTTGHKIKSVHHSRFHWKIKKKIVNSYRRTREVWASLVLKQLKKKLLLYIGFLHWTAINRLLLFWFNYWFVFFVMSVLLLGHA